MKNKIIAANAMHQKTKQKNDDNYFENHHNFYDKQSKSSHTSQILCLINTIQIIMIKRIKEKSYL